MKILLTSDVFPPDCGGSGWSTFFLAKGLLNAGYSVKVLTYDNGPKGITTENYEGVDVIRINRTKAPDLISRILEKKRSGSRYTSQLKKIINDEKPDIVHAAHLLSGLYTYNVLKEDQIPYIVTVRDYWPICLYSTMIYDGKPCPGCNSERMKQCFAEYNKKFSSLSQVALPALKAEMKSRQEVLQNAARVVFVSDFLNKKVNAKIPNLNSVTIPNGLDFGHIKNILADKPAMQIKPEYMLYIGKIEPYKGSEILKRIIQSHDVKLPIVIIGEGSGRNELVDLAQASDRRAAFFNWLPNGEVLHLMKRAGMLLFPSVWDEPLSRVLLESSAIGLPAVAMATGGTPEIITNNENGILVKNSDAFLSAVIELQDDKKRIKNLSKNHRQVGSTRYNQDKLVKHWGKLYEEVLAKGKK
ncbi:MAG: glycosyltransferase family 4 protein [Acidobacteria bacterium]|nr:glycosyltransferase family 4 protein [Acidobacteriota bacterium]